MIRCRYIAVRGTFVPWVGPFAPMQLAHYSTPDTSAGLAGPSRYCEELLAEAL